ncbi:MAG: hypothetical protein WKF73_22710 [Nocardioidaceae bacterium]
MAERVFVHIGTMKSGTTYLQSWLDRNQERLAEQGLFWNRSDRNFRATDDLFNSRKIRPGLDGAWSALKARLESHPGDALISNELLAAIAPKKAARLVSELRPAEVHVMVTARDLVKVVPSQWQTAMRNRSTVTWAQYVDDICTDEPHQGSFYTWFWNRQDVAGIVNLWSRHVPLDRFSIITVPPSGTPRLSLEIASCRCSRSTGRSSMTLPWRTPRWGPTPGSSCGGSTLRSLTSTGRTTNGP